MWLNVLNGPGRLHRWIRSSLTLIESLRSAVKKREVYGHVSVWLDLSFDVKPQTSVLSGREIVDC